ncbi:hypothetical protein AS159_00460 [Thermotoga sp. Ku-13t]|uniref:ABC transporter substrate-binding protein n=1 Tax=Thermotoga sp. Ku-13t TaxID=1755813 RepID=UPI0013E9BAE8|nr:ABC transporter substrate-binding protein [Thermotoga sp. Ku-13t]KAF2958229.1 hypothetical protein AS159_00460 [Thermotoga sp. Ku-13t]
MKLAAFLFVAALVLIVLLVQMKLDRFCVLILDDGGTNFLQGVKNYLKDHNLHYDVVTVRIDVDQTRLESVLRKYQNSYAVGPRLSSEAQRLIPILEKFRIFTIAPLVTSYRVVGKSSYLMTLSVTDEEQGRQIAERLKVEGCRKVLLVADKLNPVHSETIEESLKRHLSVEQFESRQIESIDELLGEDFDRYDGLVLALDGRKAGIVVQLARKKGFSGTIVGSDYALTDDLTTAGGPAVEEMIVCCLFDFETMLRSGISDMQIAGAYDAAMIITDLKHNRVSQQDAANYLRGRTFEGVTGRFSVNFDLSASRNLTFVRVKNGRFEIER